MASSQVKIASSFGCILRDRNQRHNDVVFKNNLKAQVKPVEILSDENSQNRVVSWIGNTPKKNNKRRLGSPEKLRTRKGNNFSGSPRRQKSKSIENLEGASSLVQIWEARLNRSNGGNSPIHDQPTEIVQETNLSAPSIDDGESESEKPDLTVEVESETLNSVAERIRRLKQTVGDNVGAVDMPEKSSFPVISPRVRGRQAFSDLLTRLERERHRELESLLERNAVSRFPQRGRLQSMLRLRSLKRGLVIQDRQQSTAKIPDLNRLECVSPVQHLREIFQANAATEAKRRKGQQSTVETESMRPKETSVLLETSSTERLNLQNRKIEEAILSKNETNSKTSYLQLQETRVTEALKSRSDNTILSITQEPRILAKEEANNVESGTQGTQETPFLDLQEQETSFLDLQEQETSFLEQQETSFLNGWEEQEEYEDGQSYYGDMSYDWFTEISRPRTYWEELRKSRYLEVMNTRSDKDDICKLLERRTVSEFLESGLREKIDKLMMSRVQAHPVQRMAEAKKEEEEEKCDLSEEDDLSLTSSQIFGSSPAGLWSFKDTGVTSTPGLLSPLHNPLSTEMEIISNLRSQMLQLQLEMSELRGSVKTCLDVNASLQKSVYRENPLKRNCCVCNETQVETLLYRCGHMCTCMRCANELLWNDGKCPICRAKILDVVRVFVDSTPT